MAVRKDMRLLKQVSWHENRLGEFHVFGEFGTGKNSIVITLAYRKTKEGIRSAFKKFERYLDKPRYQVPVE